MVVLSLVLNFVLMSLLLLVLNIVLITAHVLVLIVPHDRGFCGWC